MRRFIAKFSTLGMVGVLAFGLLPSVPAQAEVPQALQDQLNGVSGNSTAGQLVTTGDAVIAFLKTASPADAALVLSTLAQTGNANLISGVLAAPDISAINAKTLATNVVSTGNATVIATVVIL